MTEVPTFIPALATAHWQAYLTDGKPIYLSTLFQLGNDILKIRRGNERWTNGAPDV